MNYLFSALVFCFILQSCSKISGDKEWSVTGQVISKTTGMPLAGLYVSFYYGWHESGEYYNKDYPYVITDENGKFSLDHEFGNRYKKINLVVSQEKIRSDGEVNEAYEIINNETAFSVIRYNPTTQLRLTVMPLSEDSLNTCYTAQIVENSYYEDYYDNKYPGSGNYCKIEKEFSPLNLIVTDDVFSDRYIKLKIVKKQDDVVVNTFLDSIFVPFQLSLLQDTLYLNQ